MNIFLCTESLFVYKNNFSGTFPTEIGILDLTRFQAHENNFIGSVPETLFFNRGLRELRLDQNRFTGPISGRIGDLTELKDLRLSDNFFTGTIPATTARLSNLGTLNVLFLGL